MSIVVDGAVAPLPSARKYKEWRPGEWASRLPPHYFVAMGRLVEDMTARWFSPRDIAEGYADYIKVRHVFGRMEIAQTQIMPWLCAAIPDLAERTVLEIGCGSGPSTVPLALASRHVHAFDLDAKNVDVAAERCRLLDVNNVTFFTRDTNWTRRYASDPSVLSGPVDVIVCYALLEHLMPLERIDLLVGAWRHLPIGGHLVIIETPNRLYPFDWHSSLLPFADQVPEEIAYLWNGFSERASIPADIKANSREAAASGNRERLYRFGRGASFHEFHVALGPGAYRVVNAAGPAKRHEFAGWNADSIASLTQQLADLHPPVSDRFAQPCLDLVIEKIAEPRLA